MITDSQTIKPKIFYPNTKGKRWKNKMDKVLLLLNLITIAIVVIPIVGITYAYQKCSLDGNSN
jgi:hypothetical protein